MLMNKEQIMEIIPHRDPFLLIDEIEELEPGKRVVAYKNMTPDEFWCSPSPKTRERSASSAASRKQSSAAR